VLDVVLPDLFLGADHERQPGFGGQAFIPGVLPKMRALRDEIERRNLQVDISVDGGITPDTAPLVTEAGATILVAGSAVFSKPDYAQAIRDIRTAGEKGKK
jgi:ribulose-phosphate 3-epimerase